MHKLVYVFETSMCNNTFHTNEASIMLYMDCIKSDFGTVFYLFMQRTYLL